MASTVDVKDVIKHLVNGTFDDSLCRVCLLPLGELCENIFTKICKQDFEYCVADILDVIFHIKFSGSENHSVCHDCFLKASTMYEFYLLTRRSDEILEYYVNELEQNIYSFEVPQVPLDDNNLCIPLPEYIPTVPSFDYNVEGLDNYVVGFEEEVTVVVKKVGLRKEQPEESLIKIDPILKNWSEVNDDQMVIVIGEDGRKSFYKMQQNGTLESVSSKKRKNLDVESFDKSGVKRRKRDPMTYRKCSQCPVRYRFLGKLKLHMKTEHNMDLFVCKVCKAVMEDEQEFNLHCKSHTDVHRCNICNMVFKKRDTIIAHLKWHDEMKNMSKLEGAHVCELCGFILPNEDQLKNHYDKKHDKKYTCFYCGRLYKVKLGFEKHIKKHETQMKHEEKRKNPEKTKEQKAPKEKSAKRTVCATCGRNFVDERSLMWHSMLHTNERPFSCDVCGRAFVSLNRRNQHVVCAHSVPTRRCPLCPALFHLRSMVNTHIKKVHLKAHKRRNRTSKHQNVCWRTEPVPIQELSVSIQNKLLEMKTDDNTQPVSPEWDQAL